MSSPVWVMWPREKSSVSTEWCFSNRKLNFNAILTTYEILLNDKTFSGSVSERWTFWRSNFKRGIFPSNGWMTVSRVNRGVNYKSKRWITSMRKDRQIPASCCRRAPVDWESIWRRPTRSFLIRIEIFRRIGSAGASQSASNWAEESNYHLPIGDSAIRREGYCRAGEEENGVGPFGHSADEYNW